MLRILLAVLVLTGCETTRDRLDAEEDREIQAGLDRCNADDARACMKLAIRATVAGQYGAAIELAGKACDLGHRGACQMMKDMPELAAENDARLDRREQQNIQRQQNMINVLNDSARQMGTVSQPPQQTRCITKWNSFLRQQETVCE